MADVGEFWKGLRTAMLNEATLVALLGTQVSGIDDAVFFSFPDYAVIFPIITITDRHMNPVPGNTFTGEYRPTCTFNAYGPDPFALDSIATCLEDRLSTPANRAGGITTANYRVTELHLENGIEFGPLQLVDTGEQIRGLAVSIRMRLIKKT